MTTHISEELPRMLTGEASREAVLNAADHLRSCVDCQHELVSAVVAHASLTSAQRFAPEIVSRIWAGDAHLPDLQPADDADADGPELDAEGVSEPAAAPPEIPLPDLSDVFAQVRRDAAMPQRAPAPKRTGSRARYLLGAAAATVLVGGSAAVYLATSADDTSDTRTVQLAAFDTGRTVAKATIAKSGDVHIDASSLPQLDGKRYEVWLTDDSRTRMQPVGWIGANGRAAITVPNDLLSQYQDIEVSVQQIDSSEYKYSGTSVLRGPIS